MFLNCVVVIVCSQLNASQFTKVNFIITGTCVLILGFKTIVESNESFWLKSVIESKPDLEEILKPNKNGD